MDIAIPKNLYQNNTRQNSSNQNKFDLTANKIIFVLLVPLFYLFSINPSFAFCQSNLSQTVYSCSPYNSILYVKNKNAIVKSIDKQTKDIFNNQCVTHQLCNKESTDKKNSCDNKFINDIKFQCKINYGRLVVVKQLPKRSRVCLKSVKKSCANFKKNCGRTCVLYSSNKIELQEVRKHIQYPLESDYELAGAVFYPDSNYNACLEVTQGYKSSLSSQASNCSK